MKIKVLTPEDHKDLIESNSATGVYVYTNGCNLCKNQIKKLTSAGIKISGEVDCKLDAKYYLDLGYDDMPCTVLYVEGIKKFESTGEMFDLQIQNFKKMMLSICEGKN